MSQQTCTARHSVKTSGSNSFAPTAVSLLQICSRTLLQISCHRLSLIATSHPPHYNHCSTSEPSCPGGSTTFNSNVPEPGRRESPPVTSKLVPGTYSYIKTSSRKTSVLTLHVCTAFCSVLGRWCLSSTQAMSHGSARLSLKPSTGSAPCTAGAFRVSAVFWGVRVGQLQCA